MFELILPSVCAVCARFLTVHESGVCLECSSLVPGLQVPPGPQGMERFAGGHYEAGLAEAIQRLKFSRERWRGTGLGQAAAFAPAPYDWVAPVPLHPSRLRQRGYNQSDLLARGVAGALGVRLNRRLLRRVRFEGPQAELDADQRGNVHGSFSARSCPGARILVVDDVTTTGHTLEACKRALENAGASLVHGFAVAFTRSSGALDGLDPS